MLSFEREIINALSATPHIRNEGERTKVGTRKKMKKKEEKKKKRPDRKRKRN